MQAPELQAQILSFLELCPSFKGKKLIIKTAISTSPETYDRHFSTFSSMEFILTDFLARISGARAMFLGENMSYEISVQDLISLSEQETNAFELVEKYAENVYRKTIMKVLTTEK